MILKRFIPPIILEIYRGCYFSGEYKDWMSARRHSTGYESEIILNKVKESALKVKNGKAAYERDSVAFEKPKYSWPVVTLLLWIASKNENKLDVLDFGGSLGSLYFQNRCFFEHLNNFSWNIVEQENFVECGKNYFEDGTLKFYKSIKECLCDTRPIVVLLSGVLQYLEKPKEILNEIFKNKIKYVLINRTPVQNARNSDILTVQIVPSKIYKASYPCWLFNERNLLSQFKDYTLVTEFESEFDEKIWFKNITIRFMGYLFSYDEIKNIK